MFLSLDLITGDVGRSAIVGVADARRLGARLVGQTSFVPAAVQGAKTGG